MSPDGINPISNVSGSRPLTPTPPTVPTEGVTPGIQRTAGDRHTGRKLGQKSGLTGPFPNPNLEKLDWSKVPDPAPRHHYHYKAQALPNMDGALEGKISGQQTNEAIVDVYANFDKAFTEYLGNPPIANWTTFGKYAAREAGQDISRVETELSAFHMHPPDYGAMYHATKDLVFHPSLIGNFGMPVLTDAANRAGLSWDDVTAVFKGPDAIGKEVHKIFSFVHHVKKNMETMLGGLLRVHVGIYNNFSGAFDTFLRAEANGENGVEAVNKAVAAGEIKDPNHLLRDALGNYRKARLLQQKAEIATDPVEKYALMQQREDLVKRATLLIGFQEQYGVAQPLAFDDPRFRDLMGQLSPNLELHDAAGVFKLQDRGNWADFATRMGLVEIPAAQGAAAWTNNADPLSNVFRVKGAHGKYHYFMPNPDPQAREGTILTYFEHGATGAGAEKNMNNAPPPLELRRDLPVPALPDANA